MFYGFYVVMNRNLIEYITYVYILYKNKMFILLKILIEFYNILKLKIKKYISDVLVLVNIMLMITYFISKYKY